MSKEQENNVGDKEKMPDVIWARADSGNWIDYDPPALKWTKYYRSDYVDDLLEDAMQDAYKDGLKEGRRAAWGDEPEQPALSDEERQVVELVRLMREGACANITFWQQAHTKKLLVRFADGPPWQTLDEAITELRSRLAPKPQRPTQERTIAAIRAFLEVADSQDIEEQDELQRVLDDWDKAAGDDATKA